MTPIKIPNGQTEMESTETMVSDLIQQADSGTTEARPSPRPQDALLCDMELPHREIFYPLGYPVEIITNDTAVLDAANESFGHGRMARTNATLEIRIGVSRGGASECPPEPTRREYNHLYSLVADVNNQALLDFRSRINFIWVTNAAVKNRNYFRYNFLEKAVYLLLGASV